MIEVIKYQHKPIEEPLEQNISIYFDEVRKILPNLPRTIQIYFSDYGILPGSGVGGFAYSPSVITVSIDPNFEDKEEQLKQLRSTIFHESFHVFQNYTGEGGPFNAIDNAIYEGMATIFEREYCGIWQPYGDYRETPREKIKTWIKDLQNLTLKDFQDNYNDWKFFHPKLKERWIVYKVGTWIIDEVLEKNGLKILDLSTKNSAEVLDLYNK